MAVAFVPPSSAHQAHQARIAADASPVSLQSRGALSGHQRAELPLNTAVTAAAAIGVVALAAKRRRGASGAWRRRWQRRAAASHVAMAASGRMALRSKEFKPPEQIASSEYDTELADAFDIMTGAMNVAVTSMSIMEENKDHTVLGIHGPDVHRIFCREMNRGRDLISIADVAVIAHVCRQLRKKYPNDPILAEYGHMFAVEDEEFATLAAFMMDKAGVDGATPEEVAEASAEGGSFDAAVESGTTPRRYWTLWPIDTTAEMMGAKQWSVSLALVVDGEPVVGVMGAPLMAYDHAITRTQAHPTACPVFYAAKGGGAWIQKVVIEKNRGNYTGEWWVLGSPDPIRVSEKMKRQNDQLWDMLSMDQLTMSTAMRQKQDIITDHTNVARLLDSRYPKFYWNDGGLKYGLLANGFCDFTFVAPNGLYDKTPTESVARHAPGAIIAAEAGAEVADINGDPLDFGCGRLMKNNRGATATDPSKVTVEALAKAVQMATITSEEEYEKRLEEKAQHKKNLQQVFANIGKMAKSKEEKVAAKVVGEYGKEYVKEDEEMMDEAQQSINRREMDFYPLPRDDPYKDYD